MDVRYEQQTDKLSGSGCRTFTSEEGLQGGMLAKISTMVNWTELAMIVSVLDKAQPGKADDHR